MMAPHFSTMQAAAHIEALVLGPIANNTYYISDDQGAFLVDPSSDPEAILAFLEGRPLDAIVFTHRHHDHVDAGAAVRNARKVPTAASKLDGARIANPGIYDQGFDPCPIDHILSDGDTFTVGSMKWKVIATPGHTAGGICLFLDPAQSDQPEKRPVLVSGDTLFCGAVGRTDFEGGNIIELRQSLRRLQELPGDTLVLPGHGELTSIAAERRRVFDFYL